MLRHRNRVLGWIQGSLFAAAALCAIWVTWVKVQSAVEGREQRAAMERALASAPVSATAPATAASKAAAPAAPPASLEPLAPGALVGVLEIPRLGISEVVAEGESDDLLKVSIGHLADTPAPWQPGNSALAAHRDTHFRPLRDIREGDEIRLRTEHGTLTYRVRDRWIVNPDEVWVLDPSKTRRLTLITCYPFNYVGNAPQRFVVQADAVEE